MGNNSIIKTARKTTHNVTVHVISFSGLSPRFSAGEEPGYETMAYYSIRNDNRNCVRSLVLSSNAVINFVVSERDTTIESGY